MTNNSPQITFENGLPVLAVYSPNKLSLGYTEDLRKVISFKLSNDNISSKFIKGISENVNFKISWYYNEINANCWIIADDYYVVLDKIPLDWCDVELLSNVLLCVYDENGQFLATLEN